MNLLPILALAAGAAVGIFLYYYILLKTGKINKKEFYDKAEKGTAFGVGITVLLSAFMQYIIIGKNSRFFNFPAQPRFFYL